MGTTYDTIKGTHDVIRALDLPDLRARFLMVLEKTGEGIDGVFKVLALMAQGYRPIVGADSKQIARVVGGEESKRFMPKVVTLDDGTEVIRVDAKTQIRAAKIITDILGLTSSGLNVSVSAQAGAIAGNDGAQSAAPAVRALGELLVSGQRHPSIAPLQKAISQLPPEHRRRLLDAALETARDAIVETTATTPESASE